MLQVDRQNAPVFHGLTNTTILNYAPDVTANCVSGDGDVPESDCDVQATGMGSGRYQFGESSQAFLVSNSLYYLAVQSQTRYPSLYRMSMASDSARVFTEVIAEGIENMRFRYGIDVDGDATPDRYQSASDIGENIADWSKVVSIRLWLMATSVDKRGQSRFARTAWFPDRNGVLTECKAAPESASDPCPAASMHHPYRRVFSREISLRNARI
jgi:Tfp pilus assembly protein PilW